MRQDNLSDSTPIRVERQQSPTEKKLRSIIFSRRGANIISWSICFIIIFILILSVGHKDDISEQIVYIVSSLLISICITISIFARFAYLEHFPFSAFLNIGALFVLSFFQIGLAAIDIAFTKRNRELNISLDSDQAQSLKTAMNTLWNIVFWGSTLIGSVSMNFYKIYWTSGRFSIKSKSVFAIQKLLIQMAVGITILLACIGLLYFFDKKNMVNFFIQGQNSIVILSNTYSMAILILLLSHGLVKLPISLWKNTNVVYKLHNNLSRAEKVKKEYKKAVMEYYEQISICMALQSKHQNEDNEEFFEILMSEIPQQDVEGQQIQKMKSIGGLELKKNQKVDEAMIAELRYKHKIAYFQYLRKRSQWQQLFDDIDKSVQKPINYKEKDFEKKQALSQKLDFDSISSSQLILQPIPQSLKKIIFFRTLSFLSLIWTLILVSTEVTLVFNEKYTLMNYLGVKYAKNTVFHFLFSVSILSGMTLNCFFTIFNLKFSDYLQLREHQTDCIQMASIIGYCSKIINVLTFNYMVVQGELTNNYEEQKYFVTFTQIYGGMIKTPFFGSYYNQISAIFIFLFTIFFFVLALSKYNNKTNEAMNILNFDVNKAANDVKKKRKSKKKKIDKKVKNFFQNVLEGERAILKEYQSIKKKEEKNRLIMNGSYSYLKGSINGDGQTNKKSSSFTQNQSQPRQGLFQNKRKNKFLGIFGGNKNEQEDKIEEELDQNLLIQNDGKIKKSKWLRGSGVDQLKKGQENDFEFQKSKSMFPQLHKIIVEEELRSNQSQKSSHSSKYEVDALDLDDKGPSVFDSSSSSTDSDGEGKKKVLIQSDSKGKLHVQKQNLGKSDSKKDLNLNDKEISDNKFMNFLKKVGSQTKILYNNQKNDGRFEMSGWILKKASTTYLGMSNWQRRYLYLEDDKLFMFEGDKPNEMEKARKMIDMRKIQCVCYHYDKEAPIKSKKIDKALNDMSRFDIYTVGRIFHLKSEEDDSVNSEKWITMLQNCAAYYSPNYDMRFSTQ